MSQSFHSASDQFIEQVDQYLAEFFTSRIREADTIQPRYGTLWRELSRVTCNGGKQLRPRMLAISYTAFGGQELASIIPVAAALEILHSSLLIHDDIMDRETHRRGQPNVSGAYETIHYADVSAVQRRHFSDSAALLGGDLLLATASQLMSESLLPPKILRPATAVLHRAIFEVAGGQLLDSEAPIVNRSSNALLIARYKTASYSFVAPLLIGAVLAEYTDPDNLLTTFATYLGTTYQLNDDVISTFGDPLTTGKTTDSDLREKKQTYLIEYFLNNAAITEQDEFAALQAKDELDATDIDRLKQLLKASGAVDATEKLIEEYTVIIRSALDNLQFAPDDRAIFDRLVTACVRRSS